METHISKVKKVIFPPKNKGGNPPPGSPPPSKQPKNVITYPPQKDDGKQQKQSPQDGKGQESSEGGESPIDRLKRQHKDIDKVYRGKPPLKPLENLPTNDPQWKKGNPTDKRPEDAEKDTAREVKEAIKRGVKKNQKRGGNGTGLPDGFDLDILEPQVEWKNLLIDFISATSSPEYTMARPRRRPFLNDIWLGSEIQKENALESIIAIDTSGSVTREVLNVFLSEVLDIYEQFPDSKLRILLWNSPSKFDDKGNPIISSGVYADAALSDIGMSSEEVVDGLSDIAKVVKSGGTMPDCIKAYLEENDGSSQIDSLLIFTDGIFFGDDEVDLPDVTSGRYFFLIQQPGGKHYPLNKYSQNIHDVIVSS